MAWPRAPPPPASLSREGDANCREALCLIRSRQGKARAAVAVHQIQPTGLLACLGPRALSPPPSTHGAQRASPDEAGGSHSQNRTSAADKLLQLPRAPSRVREGHDTAAGASGADVDVGGQTGWQDWQGSFFSRARAGVELVDGARTSWTVKVGKWVVVRPGVCPRLRPRPRKINVVGTGFRSGRQARRQSRVSRSCLARWLRLGDCRGIGIDLARQSHNGGSSLPSSPAHPSCHDNWSPFTESRRCNSHQPVATDTHWLLRLAIPLSLVAANSPHTPLAPKPFQFPPLSWVLLVLLEPSWPGAWLGLSNPEWRDNETGNLLGDGHALGYRGQTGPL